jgi:hypothetical protein
MECTITPIWYTTTSWDQTLPFKINVNYIIK